MTRLYSSSPGATAALELVTSLQRCFVEKLDALSERHGSGTPFEAVEWFRDAGRHGGGVRYESRDGTLFNRASVNTSQVQYGDDPAKRLDAATAISTIIHPRNPHAPSMHMHISRTQMKGGEGYWRMMADLNPAIAYEADAASFRDTLKQTAPAQYGEAAAQGERYFYIPALKRHRGVTHFYLENYRSNDAAEDALLAETLGRAVIDAYIAIVDRALRSRTAVSEADRSAQLAYHTLYLFQVLTLDRGTTSGLLIHDENDVGIMGSIPSHVDRDLLASWRGTLPAPQERLLDAILDALPAANPAPVDAAVKKRLAEAVRAHYKAHPEALVLQAGGNTTPPTVDNHR